jgi:hypothetical protein
MILFFAPNAASALKQQLRSCLMIENHKSYRALVVMGVVVITAVIYLTNLYQPVLGQTEEALLRVRFDPPVGDSSTLFTVAAQNFSWEEMILVEVTAYNDFVGESINLRGADDLLALGPRRRANLLFAPDEPGLWRIQARGATLSGRMLFAESAFLAVTPGSTSGVINVGQTVSGQIREWTEGWGGGFSAWALQGQAGMQISTEVEWISGNFGSAFPAAWPDAGVVLLDSRGNDLSQDIDYVPLITLPEDGLYFIAVYSDEGETTYNLTLHEGIAAAAGGLITIGQTVTGLIEPAGQQQEWFFSAQVGDLVQITMRAPGDSALDSELDLYNPQGHLVANNDDYHGRDSYILYLVPEAGDYRIVARSHGSNSTGVYRLNLAPGNSGESRQRLEPNRSAGGNVAVGGAEAWQFEGRAGQNLIITADALDANFDPYLILYGPRGQEIGRDDDGGEGLNARLTISLPENGLYTIVVSSYDGSAGRYIVRILE